MILFGLPLWLMLMFLFVLGTVVGSFLNVCIYRLPRYESFRRSFQYLIDPPSTCPRCERRIPPLDNIPLIGWVKLRGRCRFCRTPISPRYFFIELLTGVLFAGLYWCEVPADYGSSLVDSCIYHPYGPQGAVGSLLLSTVAVVHWRYAYHVALVCMLVVATFIDFDLRIIPDTVTLPAMLVGLLGGCLVGQVYLVPLWFAEPGGAFGMSPADLFWLLRHEPPPDWVFALSGSGGVPGWISRFPRLHGLAVSLVGLIVGGGVVWAVRIVGHKALGREAMGFGDVVLMAAIGSFLGWQPTVLVFFLAPFLAILVAGTSWLIWRGHELPYGPYLSLATLLVIVFWKPLWPRAAGILSLGPLLPVVGLGMLLGLWGLLLGIRSVQRALGWEPPSEEWETRWSSADQLAHYTGEWVDPRQGQWPRREWPGINSGRGQACEGAWRGKRF